MPPDMLASASYFAREHVHPTQDVLYREMRTMSATMFAMRYPGRKYKGVHQFQKKWQKMEPRWRYGETFDAVSDEETEQQPSSGATALAGPPRSSGVQPKHPHRRPIRLPPEPQPQ